ncbi:MAG TPA: NAD-dependent epimerase/dehydratase family protein [Phycisphaerae bacterium]
MSQILVTGAAGFIGSHLVDRLLTAGHRVTGVDNFDDFYAADVKRANLTDARQQPGFELIEADIRDKDRMRALWKSRRFDTVCHLAARAGVRPSLERPELYWEVNTNATLGLLELARQIGIERFIFASSSSVYGDRPGHAGALPEPFREDMPADRPVSPYAASKRAAEHLCHAYHHLYKFPVTCLRFFTVYGPRNRPDLAIAKFTRRIDAGEPIEMFGDGSTLRDYTYINDIINGVVAAIQRCRGFEVYNLGNSHPTQLSRLIAVIEQALEKKAKIVPAPLQPGDVSVTYADVSKARAQLGFEPSTPIEEGIRRYVEWYRQHGLGFRVQVPDPPWPGSL